jgi:uncharacterized RDD family membrane protein YckC
MPALAITVLKNNVPWGPFTRGQIDDGLVRGDFTIKSLAHAPGLTHWTPLDEVLAFVEHNIQPSVALPPVPEPRNLPPIPQDAFVEKPASRPTFPAPAQPPVLPVQQPKPTPVVEKPEVLIEPKSRVKPETQMVAASFFPRGIAFLIDCAILFVPILVIYILSALAIEISGAWEKIDHESRMQEWAHLERNLWDLTLLVAIGFGWLYGAGSECSPSQATIGKRWMRIKVTDAQGERIGFVRATGRYAAKYLSALPFFLGFIMALFSSRGLALHDRLTDTRVVRK